MYHYWHRIEGWKIPPNLYKKILKPSLRHCEKIAIILYLTIKYNYRGWGWMSQAGYGGKNDGRRQKKILM